MKKIEGLKVEPVEIKADRISAAPIIGRTSVYVDVDGPAAEIDSDATYTFEAEVDGRWHRWTGQKPTIVGDRARFWLRDGTPITAPS